MRKSSQAKAALGSALATIGALVVVLFPILGWYSNPRPWVVPIAFAAGVVAGIGAALSIGGLLESRRERQRGGLTLRSDCVWGTAHTSGRT